MHPSHLQSDPPIAGIASAIICSCTAFVPLDSPHALWGLVSHRVGHDRSDVITLPTKDTQRLRLAFARAAGCAEMVAPPAAFHLDVATNVLAAASDENGLRDSVLHREYVVVLAGLARWASWLLSGTASGEIIGDSLTEASRTLESAARTVPPEAERQIVSALGIAVASGAGAPAEDLRWALEVVEVPLLHLAAPATDETPIVGHRTVSEAVAEMSALPDQVSEVESRLAVQLRRMLRSSQPLAVADELTLDRTADLVLDLQLAKLRASHLADLLGCGDAPEVGRWAAATAERLVSRLTVVTDHVTRVLDAMGCGL